MRPIPNIAAPALWLLLGASPARAEDYSLAREETITLKNGQVITGDLDAASGVISILNKHGKTITYKVDPTTVVSHVPSVNAVNLEKDQKEAEKARIREREKQEAEERKRKLDERITTLEQDMAHRAKVRDEYTASVRRAIYWKSNGYVFDPNTMTADEMNAEAVKQEREKEAERQKLAQADIPAEAPDAPGDTAKPAAPVDPAIEQRRIEELRRLALAKISKSILEGLASLGIASTGAPIYIGLDQAKVGALVDPDNTGRQRATMWCWAACVQMVCSFHDVDYPQETVVKVAKGLTVNEGGSIFDFLAVLSQDRAQDNGQPIQLAPRFTLDFHDIVNDLGKKMPMIGAFVAPKQTVGHAMVITGAEFVFTKDGIVDVERSFIDVRDPSPDSPGNRKMPFEAFLVCLDYAVRLRVTRW